MRVLFAASEACPFSKTGGLGDVIGSLPKVLRSMGIDVRVFLPKYACTPSSLNQEMLLISQFTVPVGWRKQYCGVLEIKHNDVPHYLIDNEYYFKRDRLYGYHDEAERFAFFCRAVLEALPRLDFWPDIIHCHDWQTGLVSVFLKTHYRNMRGYQNIKTVFTIHNLFYQGIFPKQIIGDLLGLPDELLSIDGLEFYGNVNYLKGGLVFSDKLTTVSKTYAEEIKTPYYGEKLDGLLRKRSDSLCGIVNGIDNKSWDPSTDKAIYVNYRRSLSKKQQNKENLQAALELNRDSRIPMLAFISRLVWQKGLDLVENMLEEILALDMQLVVMGDGEKKYVQMLLEAAARHPGKLSVNIGYKDAFARKIYAASDLFLMPSHFEPCGISQLIAMSYRSVPIVRQTGGLIDTVEPFDMPSGKGHGFCFANFDAHDMFKTIQRAVNLFPYKKTWQKIIRNIGRLDFSWKHSARQYHALYSEILGQ